ncbi:glycyl-radical enzyme activating protein [Chloroflexota bacterium]
MSEGLIFNIQRFSLQDGPGIRTAVFFNGCSLRCLWCSNPESQSSSPVITYNAILCNKCGNCLDECPVKAISDNDGKINIDRKICNNCAKCLDVCYPQAIKLIGKRMSEQDVLEVVIKDTGYYFNSGGGVTASGGEPLYQIDALVSLFKRCQKMGISTAIETCGFVKEHVLDQALSYTDLVLYDLKHMDADAHAKYTGVSNEIIKENLINVAKSGVATIVRIPMIPGINDTEENIKETASFVTQIGLGKVHILPYHRYGVKKYEMLGRQFQLADLPLLTEDQIKKAKQTIENYGLECDIIK